MIQTELEFLLKRISLFEKGEIDDQKKAATFHPRAEGGYHPAPSAGAGAGFPLVTLAWHPLQQILAAWNAEIGASDTGGQPNGYNAKIPRAHWLLNWEKQVILDYQREYLMRVIGD